MQKFVLDSSTLIQISKAKAPFANIIAKEIPLTKTLTANTPPIESTAKSPLASLVSLALVKQGCGQTRKYVEQANITSPSEICFLIDEFNTFINKNADIKPA